MTEREQKRICPVPVPVDAIQQVTEWLQSKPTVDDAHRPLLKQLADQLHVAHPFVLRDVFLQFKKRISDRTLEDQQKHEVISKPITMQEAAAFGAKLRETELMQGLSIVQKKLDPSIIVLLANGLKENKSLVELFVSTEMSQEDSCRMIEAIELHPNLRVLSFHFNGPADRCILATAALLNKNRRIASLSVSFDSPIDHQALCTEASQLVSSEIRDLSLTPAPVGPYAHLIKTSTQLRFLGLHVDFEEDDTVVLADVLRNNWALRRLDLSQSNFGRAGGLALVSALEEDNFTLTNLSHTLKDETVSARINAVLLRNGAVHLDICKALWCYINCTQTIAPLDKNVFKMIYDYLRVNARAWHKNR